MAAGFSYLGFRLLWGDERVFLPGETSHGHHQIELACESCHTERFASRDDLQAACVECHGEELREARDAHPKSKFTDPRNADRVALLDARYCTTCHREHVPEQTLAMGLTLPADYCFRCHEAIGEERPSHAGLPFDGCAGGGCHNFHDNRALYEDFLVERSGEPWLRDGRVAPRDPARRFADHAALPLASPGGGVPPGLRDLDRLVAEWRATSHARAGVDCTDCHAAGESERVWRERPGVAGCRECHGEETEGFVLGRHGMRVAAGLAPMSPTLARLPMRGDAKGELGCASCHGAHAFDVRRAAVEACLGCHDDEHSRAFEGSAHAALLRAERAGDAPPGSGVSCATCHLPRTPAKGAARVQHNQNDNLRPNEKMVRTVCLDCHGLPFTLDALADADLVRANFRGRPRSHVPSVDMAVARARAERSPDAAAEGAPR